MLRIRGEKSALVLSHRGAEQKAEVDFQMLREHYGEVTRCCMAISHSPPLAGNFYFCEYFQRKSSLGELCRNNVDY